MIKILHFVLLWFFTTNHFYGQIQIVVQASHTNEISCFSVARKDLLFASTGGDQKLKMWDLKTGLLSQTYSCYNSEIIGIGFSEINPYVASCTQNDLIIHNYRNDSVIVKTEIPSGNYFNLTFMYHDSVLVAQALGNSFIYDLINNKLITPDIFRENTYNLILFNNRYAAGFIIKDNQETCQEIVWDIEENKAIFQESVNVFEIPGMTVNEAGTLLAVVDGKYEQITLLETHNWQKTIIRTEFQSKKFNGFSPRAQMFFINDSLLLCAFSGTVKVFNVTNQKEIISFYSKEKSYSGVIYDAFEKKMIFEQKAYENPFLYFEKSLVFDPFKNQVTDTLPYFTEQSIMESQPRGIIPLDSNYFFIVQDKKYILSTKSNLTLKEYNFENKKMNTVNDLCFSNDNYLYSAGDDPNIRIWRFNDAKVFKSFHINCSDAFKITGSDYHLFKSNSTESSYQKIKVLNNMIYALTGNTIYIYNPVEQKLIDAVMISTIQYPELISNFSFSGNSIFFLYEENLGGKSIGFYDLQTKQKKLNLFQNILNISDDSSGYISAISQNKISFLIADGENSKPKDISIDDAGILKKTYSQISNDEKNIYFAGYYFDKNGINGYSILSKYELSTGKELFKIKFNESIFTAFDLNSSLPFIASCGWNEPLTIRNCENGQSFKILSDSSFWLNAVKFSPDGKLLACGGMDSKITLWRTSDWTELASLYSFGEEDFIVITPDNYYLTSKKGINSIAFRKEGNAYSPIQFDLQFNRPDIVLDRIGLADSSLVNAYRKAYYKRLKKMKFEENMFSSDFHLPEIVLPDRDKLPVTPTEKQVVIKVKAIDSKFKLDRINVWVNEVPVFGTGGIDLRMLKIYTVEKEIKFTLSQGENKIQISCLNEKGVESLKETIELEYIPKEIIKPDLYIIAIGASEYQDTKRNLTYAAKDAGDFSALFENQKDKYKNIHTIKILNQQVYNDTIKKIKQQLLKTDVEDIVIVFFAGHGLLDENLDYYLATYDMDFSKPIDKGFKYEDLDVLMDSIPARKKIIFIDACHSGEIDKEEELLLADTKSAKENVVFRSGGTSGFKTKSDLSYKNSFELMKELFADLRKGTGTIIISSAGGGEFAYEGAQWKNGVFTFSLIEGITTGNADINKNNEIAVSELQNYIMNQVQQLTDGRQKPTTRQENIENDFVIWKK